MEIRITTISENTANHGFIAEWVTSDVNNGHETSHAATSPA